VTLAAQTLALGHRDVMVAGGMESMSSVPFYFPRGAQFGHQTAADGIIKDGLWDVYNNVRVSFCKLWLHRYLSKTGAPRGHTRSIWEIVPKRRPLRWELLERNRISMPYSHTRGPPPLGPKMPSMQKSCPSKSLGKKKFLLTGTRNSQTLTLLKFQNSKEPLSRRVCYCTVTLVSLKKRASGSHDTLFIGTVTAANSSTLNDGASALVLSTQAFAEKRGIKPLARVVAMADAATHPKKFTIAPSIAIPLALKRANLSIGDISLFEINEAFSVVALANQKVTPFCRHPASASSVGILDSLTPSQLLSIDGSKLNVAGGGVSLGHPIG
jgi:acetyl-CoA C-acetyltransferase